MRHFPDYWAFLSEALGGQRETVSRLLSMDLVILASFLSRFLASNPQFYSTRLGIF